VAAFETKFRMNQQGSLPLDQDALWAWRMLWTFPLVWGAGLFSTSDALMARPWFFYILVVWCIGASGWHFQKNQRMEGLSMVLFGVAISTMNAPFRVPQEGRYLLGLVITATSAYYFFHPRQTSLVGFSARWGKIITILLLMSALLGPVVRYLLIGAEERSIFY
jgi:hypothetical protein